MRAVWYDRQGPAAEVLQLGELPTPEAGPGEVRVRLCASGVNPADCNRRAGRGFAQDFPRVIPNSDGAGVVDAVGDGVDPVWLGKRVWLYNGQRGRAFGTAAQWIALAAELVTELPADVDFAAGATLGIPCMTAHRCVFLAAPVQGRTILVTGGAGAVGHYAIQLARWARARVIATVSSEEKAEHARAAGSEHVVNYKTEDVAARVLDLTGGVGVDHVVEVEFGGNLAAMLRLVRNNGSIAAYASTGERNPAVPFYELMRRNLSLHAVMLPTSPFEARRRAQADISRWLAAGPRLLTVAARFTLEETTRAHEAVERGGKRGTVVVEIAP
ncbi:MAG TPA: NADPH:quinone reductase [Stellaceae bacterium]|nr:NADPH:quinone reductase [Stellaceae bacterium]